MLQLERVFFGCKSAVVFLRVKQARSNGVTAGSEKRNSATTRHVYWSPRQSYFFFSHASTVASDRARQTITLFSRANLGNLLCHRDERSDYVCSAIRLCSTVVEIPAEHPNTVHEVLWDNVVVVPGRSPEPNFDGRTCFTSWPDRKNKAPRRRLR